MQEMRSPKWSTEEDQLLLQECEKWKDNPIQWGKVSEALEQRTPSQCQRRWYRLSPKKAGWKKWDAEETRRLELAVERCGRNWENVSRAVGSGRTKKQCARKWQNSEGKGQQGPKISRLRQDEGISLVEAYYKHDGDWELVAGNAPKRADKDIGFPKSAKPIGREAAGAYKQVLSKQSSWAIKEKGILESTCFRPQEGVLMTTVTGTQNERSGWIKRFCAISL
ncbi:hypothetical protein PG987_004245 [Apiospora arundinis]